MNGRRWGKMEHIEQGEINNAELRSLRFLAEVTWDLILSLSV